jgi:phage tail protein X
MQSFPSRNMTINHTTIRCLPFRNQVRLFQVLFCCSTTILLTGCYSLFNMNPRPRLSQRLYSNQEKIWSQEIKQSRAKSREQSAPAGIYERSASNTDLGRPLDENDSASSSESWLQTIDSQLSSPSFKTKTVHGHLLHSESEDSDGVDLPDAIMDIDSRETAPPASDQAFTIVPDDGGLNPHYAHQNVGDGYRYRVQKGETLIQLARKFYGDASAWKRIFEANRDVIGNPNYIKPGLRLKIP